MEEQNFETEKFQIGEQADPETELEALLEYNNLSYIRKGGIYLLCFSDKGCKWETQIRTTKDAVVIYGIYPFDAVDSKELGQFIGKANSEVLYGAMLYSEGRLVFRTSADLFDAYSAYEQLGRKLEYNADVIVHYWEEAAGCCGNEKSIQNR